MACRICEGTDIKTFLSLGSTGLANNLPAKEDLDKEEAYFPLDVALCENCKLVQLTCVVPPELMFKNYLYVTSTTQTFRDHFRAMADHLTKMFQLNENSTVVDIGSNDGLLLKGFQKHGVQVVGVEPADNLVELANKEGVPTLNGFHDQAIADQILAKYGKADVITANNVFAHTDDISKIVKTFDTLLKDNGVFVFEAHYLFSMMDKMTFDAIYHEHVSYYSLTPFVHFFKRFGMNIFRVEKVASHGGSLRVFVQKDVGNHAIDSSVQIMLEDEEKRGVKDYATYENFAQKVTAVKDKVVNILQQLKKEGKTIVGYGVPAKATTLLTFCGIGKETFDYIVDDNPLKQGRYTPIEHIPIVPSTQLDEQKPDYIVILAWNFAEEIIKKLGKYKEQGVKFIIPFPEPKVIE
tara:strand:- start:22969 stop:24192 length:1224 start_codon:yes stop_codon:yes gene_type:complete